MPRKNTDVKSIGLTARVRERLLMNGLYMYQLADALNVSDMTLRRWLRTGCTAEHYDLIMQTIDGIIEGGGGPG